MIVGKHCREGARVINVAGGNFFLLLLILLSSLIFELLTSYFLPITANSSNVNICQRETLQ
jgi:hypothetical protein